MFASAVFAQANEGSPGAMTSFENKIAKSPDLGGAPGGFIKQPTFAAEMGGAGGLILNQMSKATMEPEGLARGAGDSLTGLTDGNHVTSITDTPVPLSAAELGMGDATEAAKG